MRFGLVIALICLGVVIMTNGSKIRNYNTQNMKQLTRSRTIRDNKPKSYWDSIGVGYGKRDGSSQNSDLNNREKILMSLLHNFPQGQSLEYILREMKTNPGFAEKLKEIIINDENDQTPIEEQFQPEGTVFVF